MRKQTKQIYKKSANKSSKKCRMSLILALFTLMILLNVAIALAAVQSHNLSEIRNIDVDFNMTNRTVYAGDFLCQTGTDCIGADAINESDLSVPAGDVSELGNLTVLDNSQWSMDGSLNITTNGDQLAINPGSAPEYTTFQVASDSNHIGAIGGTHSNAIGVLAINLSINNRTTGVYGQGEVGVQGVNVEDSTYAGHLGGNSEGVYGQHGDDIQGYLGGENLGAYGQWNNTIFGYFGGYLSDAPGFYVGTYGEGELGVAGAYYEDDKRKGVLGGETFGAYGQYNDSNYGMLGANETTSEILFGTLGYGEIGAGGVYYFDQNIKGILGSAAYGSYGQYNDSRYGYSGSAAYGTYGQYDSNTKGYLGGSNYGSYGQYNDSRYGYSGSAAYGTYGQYDSNTKGYLGGSNYGAYGQYNSSNYGGLGLYSYGVFGTGPTAVYGRNSQNSSRFGYLGGSVGVHGIHESGNYGQLGTSDQGVFGLGTTGVKGQNSVSATKYGELGAANYGVYGQYNENILGYVGGALGIGVYGQYNSSIRGWLGGQYGSDFIGAYGIGQKGVYGEGDVGVYGLSANDINRFGYIASDTYGVYGQWNDSINGFLGYQAAEGVEIGAGGIGSIGVYGQNVYDDNVKGYLGTQYYGAYGQYNDSIYGFLGALVDVDLWAGVGGSGTIGVLGSGQQMGVYAINDLDGDLNAQLAVVDSDTGTNIAVKGESASATGFLAGNLSTGTDVGAYGSGEQGVRGEYKDNSSRYGYLGGSNYGAYAQFDGSNYGYLGYAASGGTGALGNGAKYGVYGVGSGSNTSYGVVGIASGKWGSLGFKEDSTQYGVYGQYDSNKYGYLAGENYSAYAQFNSSNYGFLGSEDYGAYGQNTVDRFGYLGGPSYGVYGQDNSRIGYIGSSEYGVYGQYNNDIAGYLGGEEHGVWGEYHKNSFGFLGGDLYGVYGKTNGTYGVYGESNNTGAGIGVYGYKAGLFGALAMESVTNKYAVYGFYDGSNKGAIGMNDTGIYGYSTEFPANFNGDDRSSVIISNSNLCVDDDEYENCSTIADEGHIIALNGAIIASNDETVPSTINDGYVYYKGNTASYDLAEGIETIEQLEKGDVVIAAGDEKVGLTSKPFDSRVVGVVSTSPNIVFNMDDETDSFSALGGLSEDYEIKPDKAPLTLAGRVPIKVTDENGAISEGDLLTTSSRSGYAMKWSLLDVEEADSFEEMKSILAENELRRNAVIGKALESFNGEEGKIVALVTLQ